MRCSCSCRRGCSARSPTSHGAAKLKPTPGRVGRRAKSGRCRSPRAPVREPFWITDGHAYLTGPYAASRSACRSSCPPWRARSTSAQKAGRSWCAPAISVNPATAAVTITSEPFPRILQGVPLQIRTVDVDVNRPDFALNPTSCDTDERSPARCRERRARPRRSQRPTRPRAAPTCRSSRRSPSRRRARPAKRTAPRWTVEVAQKPGEADIHKVDVQLPLQFPSRLTTLQKACTEAQFSREPGRLSGRLVRRLRHRAHPRS